MKKFISAGFFYIVINLFFNVCPASSEQDADVFFKNQDKYANTEVETVLGTTLLRLRGGEIIELIGIKGPEIKKRKKTVERDEHGFPVKEEINSEIPMEESAVEYVRNLIAEKKMRLEFDIRKRSNSGYTLAYVFLKDEKMFLNTEILRMGYADLSIQPPNIKYAEEFRAAYREARAEQRGLLAD